MKMRKFVPVLILVLALFITVGASSCTKEAVQKTNDEVTEDLAQEDTINEPIAETAIVKIDMPARRFESIHVLTEGVTAYDLLVESAEIHELKITTKDYDFGLSIEGIGDYMGGTNNKYWIFYVNDLAASQGADATKVKAGDIVEFRYEESTF